MSRARSARTQQRVESSARNFFEALGRTNTEERAVVLNTFLHTCSAELPENVHANVDLIRRVTGFSEGKILRLAAGLRSLGFYAKVRERDAHDGFLGTGKTLVLEWHDLSAPGAKTNATDTGLHVLRAASDSYCPDCATPLLQRLDFSQLATATHNVHTHASTHRSPRQRSDANGGRRRTRPRPS